MCSAQSQNKEKGRLGEGNLNQKHSLFIKQPGISGALTDPLRCVEILLE
jgi:hypothetical protein